MTLAGDIEVLARFGRALADPIRCRMLLALREAPAHPADLADSLGISRTRLSNHLACLRDCGLVVAVPVGRRTRYELADARLGHALDDLRGAVLAVEPAAPARTRMRRVLLMAAACPLGLPPARRAALARRIRLLVAATITYNVIEASWRSPPGRRLLHRADRLRPGLGHRGLLRRRGRLAVLRPRPRVREAREKTTLRIIAVSFFALAAYVTVDAVRALLGSGDAQPLHRRHRARRALAGGHAVPVGRPAPRRTRTGLRLRGRRLQADPAVHLPVRRAAGRPGRSTPPFGWSWADPIAALVIAAVAVKEGRDAWRGDTCCAPGPMKAAASDDTGCSCGPDCTC